MFTHIYIYMYRFIINIYIYIPICTFIYTDIYIHIRPISAHLTRAHQPYYTLAFNANASISDTFANPLKHAWQSKSRSVAKLTRQISRFREIPSVAVGNREKS